MITDFNGTPVHVSVISTERASNVKALEALLGFPATWYVKPGETADYIEAGASRVVEVETGLCGARNAAINDGSAQGAYTVEFSDDLTGLAYAVDKKLTEALTASEAIIMVLGAMKVTGLHLGGVAPTSNPYFSDPNKRIHTHKFIVGDFIIISPDTDLRFDENLKLKEDYDYTLQHLHRYGGAARVDSIMATFKHRTNPGGAVAFRNAEREQEAIAYLKAKWPHDIRDNPRRENEILMKWRKVNL